MPLYYLNNNKSVFTFYTDSGNVRSALMLAKQTDFVRFKYFVGRTEFTKKSAIVYQNKISPAMRLLTEWLPSDMIYKRLLDMHMHAEEFVLEFKSGIQIEFYQYDEMVIRFNNETTLLEIMDLFEVPIKARAPLINEPGSLISVIKRTGHFRYWGHFEDIRIWLQHEKVDAKFKKAFFPLGLN